jgi:hypothetical protein
MPLMRISTIVLGWRDMSGGAAQCLMDVITILAESQDEAFFEQREVRVTSFPVEILFAQALVFT